MNSEFKGQKANEHVDGRVSVRLFTCSWTKNKIKKKNDKIKRSVKKCLRGSVAGEKEKNQFYQRHSHQQ